MIAGALAYYQFNSWRNRLLLRIRRLRQPKYLMGAVVGGLYFYWYFVRNLGRAPRHTSPMAPTIAALVVLVMFLLAWIVPRARAALSFTEAEVALLFPAPINRRTLIHFKLLRSQAVILVSAIFMTIIGRSWGGGNVVVRTIGWWVVFATFNLHLIGSSFVMTRLMDRGLTTARRRILVLTIVAGFLTGLFLWARQTVPAPPSPVDEPDLAWLRPYADKVLHSGPLPWLLAPFRLIVAPYFATTGREFFLALPAALLVMGLHYVWVMRTSVAFEEASLELSRKQAEKVAAIRSGNWMAAGKNVKARRPPFRLGPTGPPALALFWKNLISAGNMVTGRIWLMLLWTVIFSGALMRTSLSHAGGTTSAIAFLALILTAMSLFWGPQMLRNDLRQDLPVSDVLKLLPMPGWQMVLGEVLAPAAILAGAQWLLLLIALFLFPNHIEETALPLSERAGVAVAAALVLPCVDLIAMLIPNAAVLFFPAWFQLGKDGPRGFETTGQQLILMFGQLILLALALLPAALVFAAVYVLAALIFPIGVNLIPPGVFAAIVLLAEAGLGVKVLGRVFERFDLSDEVLQAGPS
jgi:hypothetical protein